MAKLSAAHKAIATRRGVVNISRAPQPAADYTNKLRAEQGKLALLDRACHTLKIAWNGSRGHVPIRDRAAHSCPRGGVRRVRPACACPTAAIDRHRSDPCVA